MPPITNTITTAHTLPTPTVGDKIGLFGGSFNPAHSGHADVSQTAVHALGLSEIWWLVSPQNPLKTTTDTAPINTRTQSCINITMGHHHTRIVCLETLLKTQYTADTVQAVLNTFKGVHFTWVMGADNLDTLPRWQNWQTLIATIPIALVHRHGYTNHTPHTVDYLADYAPHQTTPQTLCTTPAPAWADIAMPPNPANSTEIRGKG